MLSQHLIDELSDILEQEGSSKLSKDEMAQIASELLRFFELLAKQDYETNHKKGSWLHLPLV